MVISSTILNGKSMALPEVITSKSRSESAKKMWERRKAKQIKEESEMSQAPIKAWVYHSEWFALMATVITCFLFVHRENVHLTERLDNHIEAINRRVDESNNRIDNSIRESNRRSDEIHRDFCDLIKETRKGAQ
jgi:hypothetical protein